MIDFVGLFLMAGAIAIVVIVIAIKCDQISQIERMLKELLESSRMKEGR